MPTPFLLQHYLNQSSRINPDKIAATCGEERITFSGLDCLSDKLAGCLKENGILRQDRVAFCLKRSINSLIALNGILKADAIYVPLDAKSPPERLEKIISDCLPKALICDEQTMETVKKINSKHFVGVVLKKELDHSNTEKSDYIAFNVKDSGSLSGISCKNIDLDLACILYTSGSSGDPKGVMISHSNIISYIEWAVNCFEVSSRDNILSTAPFHFDMSTFDIFCALKSGATLCISTERQLLFPATLLDLMEKEKITIWKGISSLLMYISRTAALKDKKLPSLEKILFAGESLPTKYLIDWMTAFPEKQFFNAYGPTEATGVSLYHPVTSVPKSSLARIPIGRSCANMEAMILSEDNLPVRTGAIGELCLRGSGLSRGYWNDPVKTRKAFVANPQSALEEDRIYRTGDLARRNENGEYEFMGRLDNQIKIMGYRIDLGEIENALISDEKVKDAAVILHRSEEFKIDELVAFLVAGSNTGQNSFRKNLKYKIPAYMIPHRFIILDSIPRTARGKIDRTFLTEHLCNHQ